MSIFREIHPKSGSLKDYFSVEEICQLRPNSDVFTSAERGGRKRNQPPLRRRRSNWLSSKTKHERCSQGYSESMGVGWLLLSLNQNVLFISETFNRRPAELNINCCCAISYHIVAWKKAQIPVMQHEPFQFRNEDLCVFVELFCVFVATSRIRTRAVNIPTTRPCCSSESHDDPVLPNKSGLLPSYELS